MASSSGGHDVDVEWTSSASLQNIEGAKGSINMANNSRHEGYVMTSTVDDVKDEPTSPVTSEIDSAFIKRSTVRPPRTYSESLSEEIDDDDDDKPSRPMSAKDHRRYAHMAAEQKRRDAIKKGYEDLQKIVPSCHQNESPGAQKMSKAVILQKTIEYMSYLGQQMKLQEEELLGVKKEVVALKIMKAHYEQIAKAHQNQPSGLEQKQVSDQVKFDVFKDVLETQFVSFNSAVSVNNFDNLSSCIFTWLEEYCKPQVLRDIVINALQSVNNQNM